MDGDTVNLAGKSSNGTLVPASAIVFGGSGAGHTVTITLAAAKGGSATISHTASDGRGGTAALTFNAGLGSDKAERLSAANGTNLVLGLGGNDKLNRRSAQAHTSFSPKSALQAGYFFRKIMRHRDIGWSTLIT